MKNIHVLPTDKPSRLVTFFTNKFHLCKEILPIQDEEQYQHIYITNSEEIKEGTIVKIPCGVGKVKELHWKYGNDNPSYIVEDLFVYKLRYGQKEGELQTNSFRHEDVKKIILTDNTDLIKDGVQSIDDDFLEWFVKNPSCELVEVEGHIYKGQDETEYKIIIPKEELHSMDDEVECNMCGGYMYLLPDNSMYVCTNSECTRCYEEEGEEPKQETLEEVVSKQFQEDFNKEVGKVLTQELQKRESETPVEWIYRNLLENPISNQDVEYNEAVFHNAKEMEKEQDKKLYSEEEVVGILIKAYEDIGKRKIPNQVVLAEWFEQFKK